MENDSRAKMIASAATLISLHGINDTSFSDVLDHSGAPRGSIYHHFPEGKAQLAEDAVRWTSSRVMAHQAAYAGTTARGVVERFIAMWRNVVVSSNATAGCVVAGVTVDTTATDVRLAAVTRATFKDWIDLLTGQLVTTGIEPDRAMGIATATLAGMEGALILCRAERSVAALDRVATELLRAIPAE